MVDAARWTVQTSLLSRLATMALVAVILGGGSCNPDAYSLYVLDNYGSVRGEMIDVDGESFAVLDKPKESRLLVAHIQNFYPLERWRDVATTFLHRSGRHCELMQVKEVTPRQIEFRYACG